MQSPTALILRRMRPPLLVLVVVYAVSLLGMVLIPGPAGQKMDFLHAFYFVSYMASTIGFGEIPFEFSPAQRLWVSLCIYLTTIAWLYAIGSLLTLVQHPLLQQSLTASSFRRRVRRIRTPFYLVCGAGETGGLMVRALARRGVQSVVIDSDGDTLAELQMLDLTPTVPILRADAGRAANLKAAGLEHRHCAGVIALTGDDLTNLQIALASKLLNPQLRVIARADTHETKNNMASFGTDYIINPFDTFAEHLAIALESPSLHLLYEWLTGPPGMPLAAPITPPRGVWVLCGFGRFGQAVRRYLYYEGVKTVVIEARPEFHNCDDCIRGRGTEEVTLREAGLEQAVGIVAGTDHDADNLSIIMTARAMMERKGQPLFTVARQNRRHNKEIFQAAKLNLAMQPSFYIMRRIMPRVTAPLLADFLRLARHRKNDWACEVIARLSGVLGEVVPDIWTVSIDDEAAPAIADLLAEGKTITLGHLLQDPRNRERRIDCIPLMIRREGRDQLLPEESVELCGGDQLLFCARVGQRPLMSWTLCNHNALRYALTGEQRPEGFIWRWLSARLERGSR